MTTVPSSAPAWRDIEARGGAGTIRIYADEFLVAALLSSGLLALLERVATLPSVQGPVEVFPDVAEKPFGFPAGTVVTSAGDEPFVYPTAVPDVACGYDVVATGVDSQGWTPSRAADLLASLAEGLGVRSPCRVPIRHVPIDAVLADGLAAVPRARNYDDSVELHEQRSDWRPDPSLLSTACREALAALLGSVTGHFVTLYKVDRCFAAVHSGRGVQTGEIVAVIHTGAPTIRAYAYEHFFVPIAERCLERGDIDPDLIAEHGLYGIPIGERLARDFLSLTSCAGHYGYVNRHLVTERVLHLLDAATPAGDRLADPELLRHTSHAAFEPGRGGTIVSRRGVQPLRTPDAQTSHTALAFITGGPRTHAYLVAAAEQSDVASWRCGHGTPMWTPDGIPPHLVDPCEAVDLDVLAATAPDVAANTPYDPREFWRDAINLESVIASMQRTRLATRVACLHPLVNYRERHLDA